MPGDSNARWIAELAEGRITRVKKVIDAREEVDMLADFVDGMEIEQRIARQLRALIGFIAAIKLRSHGNVYAFDADTGKLLWSTVRGGA